MTNEEIQEYKSLIYYIINRVGKFYDKDDLFQVGCIGLIKAKQNYSYDKSTKFTSYAYKYILGEIIKYIKEDIPIKKSIETMKLYKVILRSSEALTQILMKTPSIIDISNYTGIDPKIIEKVLMEQNIIQSFDDESINLSNTVAFSEDYYKESLLDLKNALSILSKEEKELIEKRYFEECTQNETSKDLGITQVQVSRCEQKILTKLRSTLV